MVQFERRTSKRKNCFILAHTGKSQDSLENFFEENKHMKNQQIDNNSVEETESNQEIQRNNNFKSRKNKRHFAIILNQNKDNINLYQFSDENDVEKAIDIYNNNTNNSNNCLTINGQNVVDITFRIQNEQESNEFF
ncbi:hypothetical protein PPERSA_02294 [Pseudocohnilembus persalinus]|uniref:Uncharacterized protein n=1 Tax=Pseudocohnilembus persalinus TaxID=266149 RepID=A0A0V0QHW0_PSEPJ|nr:hypothetical protein PPERSA_02294 [Pseudocohnilembus persalinus]|eukprot:KRX01766.1 hypothetical protein PPERSA_02294 [Pseudocohnilembus persalinus]